MTIKEAETQSGISSRNIRYYEQKGLLAPNRNRENDYREYTEKDIKTLKLIRALRMVDMPIEQIREVMRGEIPLRAAVTEQKSKLKEKLKKLETAVHFCDELAKENEPDIEEVLMRMDEPDNRKQLSVRWTADHTETLKSILYPLGAGLIPLVLGAVYTYPMLIAVLLNYHFAFVLALTLPALWMYLGYYFCKKGYWWRSLGLAHLIPSIFYGLLFWQESLPYGEQSFFITEIGGTHAYLIGWILMNFDTPWSNGPVSNLVGFLILVVCFCLGGALTFPVKWIRTIRAKKERPEKEERYRFIPPRLLTLFSVILIPALLLAFWACFGPLPASVTTESLEGKLSSWELWVEKPGFRYALTGTEEFAESFRFDRWERKYFWSNSESPLLEVHLGSDPSEAYVIEFYSDGTVRVHEAWLTSYTGYYTVPEEQWAEVWEYTQEYGTREALG